MAYQATVIEVMIASPSDVPRERQIAQEVVHEWNAAHSKDKSVVLIPAGWETHSAPLMGVRAQDVINEEVLKHCDLLIGIFWTRIGTPTGQSKSGTVEEIQKHVASSKPAMLYFSTAPALLDNVDQDQYAELKAFKEECKKNGLLETYADIHEFHRKFAHQLAIRVNNDKYLLALTKSSIDTTNPVPEVVESMVSSAPNLSDEAKTLLIEASHDQFGSIRIIHHSVGLFVQTNQKAFGADNNRRSQATWEAAVNELEREGLIQGRGYEGEYFELTNEGYKLADILKSSLNSAD